jgi:hypothetical protein
MKVGFASFQVVEVSDLSKPGGREEIHQNFFELR